MIYLFTWNTRSLIVQEALRWKSAFCEKHGVENVIHISNLEQVSGKFVIENFLSRSLFSEKRLILIDGFPYAGERSFSGAADMETLILENISKIPAETLVVFLSENPDKRTLAYKELSKIAEIKNFSLEGEDAVYQHLAQRYSTIIEAQALKKLIFLKGGHLQKCISDIEKLSLTREKISLQDIETHIMPEFEESIFVFIDTLLTKNKTKVFAEFSNLLEFSNLYALYQSLLANLRVFLYIEYLKSQKKSPSQIGDILKLGNRQFLIGKKHACSFSSISQLYTDLLDYDKNMKFGKFISSDEDDLEKEIERIFLRFLAK